MEYGLYLLLASFVAELRGMHAELREKASTLAFSLYGCDIWQNYRFLIHSREKWFFEKWFFRKTLFRRKSMRFMVTVLFHTCSEPNKKIMFVDEVISCWTIVIDESKKVLHHTLQDRIGRRIRACKKLRMRSHSWGIVPFSVSIVKL